MRYPSFADLFVKDDPRSSELRGQLRTSPPSWFWSQSSTSHRIENATTQNLTNLLPYILITSDLGVWDHTHQLQFSHFLADDPSLAVFSRSQGTPVPVTWRNYSACPRWRSYRCRWKGCDFEISRPCSAQVIVGSRGQHKMPSKTMRYWSAPDGILLVDWDELCEDYLRKEQTEDNIEENAGSSNGNATGLCEMDHGRSLSDAGHWDRRRKAKPTNPAEMKPACV
jgi:hypothetical protein